MLDVIVSVRCDGSVSRRSIAPDPSAVHGRSLFDEPQPLHCPSKVFTVVSTRKRGKETVKVSVVRRNCRVEHLENGVVVGTHDVFDKACDFEVAMWKRKGMTDSRGFRIITALYTDPKTNKDEWRTLPEKYWFEAIFEGLEAPEDGAAAMDEAVVPDEPAAPLLLQRGRKPLLWAKWRKWRAEHPIGPRIVTQWMKSQRKYRMAELQALRDLMRKGKWFPKEKEMCEEDAQGKYTEVPEDALPALEREMKEDKDSGRHLVRVVSRYGMDYKGSVPTTSALCTLEQAFNVREAYSRCPEPKKGRAGVWDNPVGVDRANKSMHNAIDSVQETLCCIRDLNRLIANASSKAQKELLAELLVARKFVTDTRQYIEVKFRASFGSKVIKEGMQCFVRKENTAPKDNALYSSAEGTVVGVDPETRATIIAVGNEREQYHLPDRRVHFNRKDAEEGKLQGPRPEGGKLQLGA
jgi:hypothetical protein